MVAEADPLWLAESDDGTTAPVIFHRRVGDGHAIYLACDAFASRPMAFQEWLLDLLATKDIRPAAQVFSRDAETGQTGPRQAGGVQWKEDGDLRYVLLARGENDLPQRLVFDRKAHIYDVLNKAYVGYGDHVDYTATQYTLRLFALLPYAVERLALEAPKELAAGSDATISAELAVKGGEAQRHWFRVEVFKPDGTPDRSYADTVAAPGGRATISIPFALNDAIGTWRIRVTDAAFGTSAETSIALHAAAE